MALALCSLIAVAAQAAPTWQVGGSTLAEGKTATVSSAGGPFELSVPEIGSEIRCRTESDAGTVVNQKNAKGELQGYDTEIANFTGCEVVGASGCTVSEPIHSEVSTELISVGSVIYDKYASLNGTLTNPPVKISGASCPIAGEYKITGNTAARLGPAAVEETFEFSEAISKASGTQLFFEGLKA